MSDYIVIVLSCLIFLYKIQQMKVHPPRGWVLFILFFIFCINHKMTSNTNMESETTCQQRFGVCLNVSVFSQKHAHLHSWQFWTDSGGYCRHMYRVQLCIDLVMHWLLTNHTFASSGTSLKQINCTCLIWLNLRWLP